MADYFVHPTSIVEDNVRIGSGTRIWHFCHIVGPSQIGPECTIGQNVFVAKNVRIGRNVKIQNNVSVYEGVVLENDVFCGPSMVFTNVMNPRAFVNRKSEYLTTLVRKGATIGANATVLCGVTIGTYALIGAGSVVTRDAADYALVFGNPARQRGWVCKCGEKLALSGGHGVCRRCGGRYMLRDKVLGPVGEA